MTEWDAKLKDLYGGATVNKGLVNKESMVSGLPLFVAEWLVKKFYDHEATDDGRQKMADFITRYLPSNDQKEYIRSMLMRQGRYTILDEFEVTADLKSNRHRLRVRKLDIEDGYIPEQILDENPRLLSGGVWGAGTLEYDGARKTVTLTRFVPLMIANFKLDLFVERRAAFTVDEWIEVLISSQGLNPGAYPSLQQRLWIVSRMLPLVEPNLNLIELAPKGTGKTHLFKSLSYYSRVISGGTVTPAVLFYSNTRPPVPGLLVNNDVVVFDEVQSIDFPNADETVGILKDYMNSGSFTRGRQQVSSSASIVMLGNIQLDAQNRPLNKWLFSVLPREMQETAFLDRVHGFIPGWEIPKIGHSSESLSYRQGFCADYFSEAMHALRDRPEYARLIDGAVEIGSSANRRDELAIKRLAAGLLKLLFPHMRLSDDELRMYVLGPAKEMRQIVRTQLAWRDPEYKDVDLEFRIKPGFN